MNNIYFKFLRMEAGIKDPVIATVIGTEGSTPQKPGSSAIFGNGGLITGTVGGGVVEWRTQEISQECGQSKISRFFHYNLDKDTSEPEEAICGGSITILIDADPLAHIPVFKEIDKTIADRESGLLITKVTDKGNNCVNIDRYWLTRAIKPDLHPEVIQKIEPFVSEIRSSYHSDNCRKFDLTLPGEESASTFFLENLFPMPELIIAGAGHVGKALSHLGRMLGFEVTVIDNRHEYANYVNLPDADHVIVQDIGRAMEEIKKSDETYIVIVTRGHSDDSSALRPCIGSSARYVGMIGSKPKVTRMHSDFILNGWATEEEWSRIYTPIGLEIKSKTVEEIAVSIAAQLVQVRNNKN